LLSGNPEGDYLKAIRITQLENTSQKNATSRIFTAAFVNCPGRRFVIGDPNQYAILYCGFTQKIKQRVKLETHGVGRGTKFFVPTLRYEQWVLRR